MPDLLARLKAALADRYRVEREVGRGRMATVYLAARHPQERRLQWVILNSERQR